jgi:hypothetical protein
VQRDGRRLAHQPGGAERAVEARHHPHLEDLRHAAARLADAPAERAVELDLRAGVGLVAELVLQALDRDGVARAVGQPPRHEPAAQAGRLLRQHQMRVAHRRREEPLVAGEARALAPRVGTVGLGARGVGAHVGAALLLGHAHAHRQRGLAIGRDVARVVGAVRQLGQPSVGDRRVAAQRRRDGVGHRHGAQHRRFQLREEHEARRPSQVGVRRRVGPRRAVQAGLAGRRHQRVVARMELDLVDAAPDPVVRAQLRRMHVGEPRVALHVGAAGERAERVEPARVEARGVAGQRVAQRAVGRVQVRVDERLDLVEDVVRAHASFSTFATARTRGANTRRSVSRRSRTSAPPSAPFRSSSRCSSERR